MYKTLINSKNNNFNEFPSIIIYIYIVYNLKFYMHKVQ